MGMSTITRDALLAKLSEKKISWQRKRWKNYMEDVQQPNAIIVQVKNNDDVQKVIQAIKEMNDANPESKITLRAAAGWKDEPGSTWCCFPWKQKQKNTYNESFSFSQGARADVILRFDESFHTLKNLGPIEGSDDYLVQVNAGVQIAQLADWLRKQKLSLPTVSMIAWVTAVGLLANGGHGTGKKQPAFSGLIESMTICDMNGEIRTITRDDKDFTTLCAAHAGMLGVVLNVTLRVNKAFNLEETIRNYHDVETMNEDLDDLTDNNDYFTLMRIPTYPSSVIEERSIDKWHVRLWNKTDKKRTAYKSAPYAADASSLSQELQVQIGDSVQDFLLDAGLQHLFPAYMLLTAAVITKTRGTDARVDYENHITHYQVGFPKSLRDVSYFIPVNKAEAGEILGKIAKKVDDMLLEAAEQDEYPLTYAMYVRYLKGTSGGLSATATGDDQRILAIDMVTHPDAPGIQRFEEELLAYFNDELGIKPRHHPGKNFPTGVYNYADFLDADALDEYRDALTRWYKNEESLANSPFITPYMNDMVFTPPGYKPEALVEPSLKEPLPGQKHTDEERARFLDKLVKAIRDLPLADDHLNEIRDNFIEECNTMKNRLSEDTLALS
ncbi:FAD-binding protein [Legionella spiritensis]|uniref:L-gulono-gamma-lactone oxidase n=1 Tax=Legionella spiritensis TaxID=452 RepID=A0A0W0Z4E2_LEGSP|nr:FAD-binding protein [Legionella spiritensis]KTD64004.1 L-gulono-gamma-lactone oxidase [Legionella spiritensis]SNV37112.1 L-gulono-gamma-lactone oxidase [Legionella spiritensis]